MSVRRGELDGAPDGDDVVLKFPVDELGAVVCAVPFGGADVLGVGFPLPTCVDRVRLGVHEEHVTAAFINETYGEPTTVNVWDGERAFCVAVYSVAEHDGGMAWWLGFRCLVGSPGGTLQICMIHRKRRHQLEQGQMGREHPVLGEPR